ncbi:hypothetical protein BDA99DRAFT_517568 [Phascolomyces articulosus]|uniref:Secreted protein n=1 Tax=Phascolomyces articulosus TaxID=60185 RepID=A0AAD5K4S8_9FUNG|nr:hypothetical protein BDA99DRAFT_517568 [Phascolomyces articulosus]
MVSHCIFFFSTSVPLSFSLVIYPSLFERIDDQVAQTHLQIYNYYFILDRTLVHQQRIYKMITNIQHTDGFLFLGKVGEEKLNRMNGEKS